MFGSLGFADVLALIPVQFGSYSEVKCPINWTFATAGHVPMGTVVNRSLRGLLCQCTLTPTYLR